MKNVFITLLLLSLCNKSIAQEDFDFVFTLGANQSILSEEPLNNTNDVNTSLDYKMRAFIEYKKSRFGTIFQSHQSNNFYKWAIAYDFKFTDFLLQDLTAYIGPELGLIKRTNRDGHIKIIHDWVQVGANLDLKYRLSYSNIAIGINYNMYRAEEELRDYGQLFRHDVNLYVSLRLGS